MRNIYDLTLQELEEYFIQIGEKPFRATQVYEGLYKKRLNSFDEMTNLKLEVKPPKVPMKKLVESGMVKENQSLYNKDGIEICKVNIDGNVYDNDEVLSIHKMSAKYLNRTNNNGWDYFYVKENEVK